MAPSIEQLELPDIINPKDKLAIPWMQLGELDPRNTLTPPPLSMAESCTAKQRATIRFAVHGNAVGNTHEHSIIVGSQYKTEMLIRYLQLPEVLECSQWTLREHCWSMVSLG